MSNDPQNDSQQNNGQQNSSQQNNDQQNNNQQNGNQQNNNQQNRIGLAPHELLELHELMNMSIVGAKKIKSTMMMVQDPQLRGLMEESYNSKKASLQQMQSFLSSQPNLMNQNQRQNQGQNQRQNQGQDQNQRQNQGQDQNQNDQGGQGNS